MEQSIIEKTNKIIKGRSIFLIGMMASGKSRTGSVLAELLRYKYIDLDKLIEKIVQKTINEIFQEDGEKEFRDLETSCLKETIKIPSLVISTGGGIVTKPENWGVLRQGIIIWIDIKQEIALKRLKNDIDNRPLLQGEDLSEKYRRIFESRKNLYSQADLRVEVANEKVEEVAKKIIYEIHKKIIN
tara:strand:- start:343 stop:900 length:558 start_codon:yes stop_codon:yes gene_type:complete